MSDAPPSSVPEPLAEELSLAGVYPSQRDGAMHGLVVLAMGHPYWLEPDPAGWRLLVESRIAPEAARQLALFDRESAHWPPHFATDAETTPTRPVFGPLLWCLALIGVHQLQLRSGGAVDSRAMLDAEAVFQRGEFWRPFTALFLHADAAHLTGNLMSGFFVLSAVLSAFGRLRGWLLFAAAAVMGNLLVAAASSYGHYRSLGASTAVFGGLGLLTGRAVRFGLGSRAPGRWRPVLLPVAAGLTLLGLFGAGEPQTDAAAHGAGFLAGLVLGFGFRKP